MAIVNIDGQDYDVDALSEESKKHIGSIKFVDAELVRLQAQAAVLQTARVAYSNALKAALVQSTDGTIKVS